MTLRERAIQNLADFAENPYPGRFLILGISPDKSNLAQIYGIMGRSAPSRNRVFTEYPHGRVEVEVADESKILDDEEKKLDAATQAELIKEKLRNIVYTAMAEGEGEYIVSNGNQTSGALSGVQKGWGLAKSLMDYTYEDDGPNFTSRITGHSLLNAPDLANIAVLRRGPTGECERLHHLCMVPMEGLGYCISTYAGNGNPLPAFQGEPLIVPIPGGDAEEVLRICWKPLDKENLVSMAVKLIDQRSGTSMIHIKNKYQKVAKEAPLCNTCGSIMERNGDRYKCWKCGATNAVGANSEPMPIGDEPLCTVCGTITVRTGSGYKCPNCKTPTGFI
ncbi:hypothetical protein KW807_01945 [Candidatus Parcubacteria bacterium]|nr:hypothetical protein [Candidatus Parcubacteria bacterium]